jgi:hypothetical protein
MPADLWLSKGSVSASVCPDVRQRRLVALTGFERSFDLIESAREQS